MRESLFHLRRDPTISIQAQIRSMMVAAILDGQIPAGAPVPSYRKMAKNLGVSRNTVVLAYQSLVDDGFLMARERSGYYVSPDILDGRAEMRTGPCDPSDEAPDWESRFRVHPSRQRNIGMLSDWRSYPYPFIYGQVDQSLFPLAEWRECSRQALSKKIMEEATCDSPTDDDQVLVEQIRQRLLPRRGISAAAGEILITLGAQNAIYLAASVLMTRGATVAMEDPGYADVRNIVGLRGANLLPIPVDDLGLPVDTRLDACDYVFVTPSHQSPTTVTLPMGRREALLEKAVARDFLIIEDDYEAETNYVSGPMPAIKSLDRSDRVIYVGSLSKTMFPGLRVGYLVGPERFIEEARALRRLMLRHPPNNNQRTVALFLALGHYDALVSRMHKTYRARWERMGEALAKHLPHSFRVPTFGGTSYWVEGPEGLDADALALRAAERGVIIEPGRVFFNAEDAPTNFFRLGFSSIPLDRIEPGIRILADLIRG